LSKKAEARQAAAEDEARKADEAEAKARERAAIEARDMAETAPSIARRRVRGTFANTTKAPPPIIAEALKAKEAATKAAKEAEDKAAKEAEEAQASVNAAKEAEAKAAKEAEEAKAVQDKYMKMTLDAFKKQAEDKAAEEEIQRKAEEAAKSASKAAERQADLLKRAEEERKRQAEEYAAKQKEEAARAFRPTSGRSSAAVPKATGLKPPEGRPPPTETEIQDVLSTFAEDTKPVTTPATKSLARVEKKQLTDEQRSDVISRLEDIRDGLMSHMEDARRNTQLTAGLWPNWSAWMRMEQEKKRHKMFVAPAVKKLLTFKDAIESSGLDALRRPPYDTAYANLLKMVVKLVNDSQTRIQNITTDAKPSKIVFGGRRRKMKRKSTRRYVA
jgi:DNA polymerase III alpha subunit (gram-positive type)